MNATENALLSGNSTRRNEVFNRMGAYPGMNNGDFAFFFADIFVLSVQYGGRTKLCGLMENIQNEPFAKQLDAIKKQAVVANAAP